ncbi:MAG: nucleotidyltransferase domain-containing protein [Thermodesulfobacteriota bacterium]|nr:nucleotidyltransferase domain-containing protein [Thermodesulfobacteriota bacterium]
MSNSKNQIPNAIQNPEDKTGEENFCFIFRVQEFFLKKAKDYYIELAFVYGSRTTNHAREESDLDIAILFSSSLTDDEIFSTITDLSLKLSELLEVEVNIIPLYEYFPKPMLYYNVVVAGIPVYISDFNKYVDFKLMALHQMEDFTIFGLKWQIELARKNLEALKND